MSITQRTGSVQSADGTTIGYRQVGGGPGVVLVHGGGQSSQNLMTLARALSDRFTVYAPDRRGRGMSGPHREDHGIRRLAGVRPILSEVGYKDADRSALLTPSDWVNALAQDLAAGAWMVITEARESGRSGIARADGHMRPEVLSAVLRAIDPAVVMFEAPTKDLQVEMIRAVGPAVNLGNVAAADVIGVETLRRGLRGDTLLDLTTGGLLRPARTGRPAVTSTPSAA